MGFLYYLNNSGGIMSIKNLLACLMGMALLATFTFMGCSDATTNSNNGWADAEFPDYEQIVEEVAPPPYEPPQASVGAVDPMWTNTYLGKVFSEYEPMSLYSNLATFQSMVDQVEMLLLYNDSLQAFALDSAMEGIEDYVQLTELSAATAFPADIQAIMGTDIDLDYFVSMEDPGSAEGYTAYMGFTYNETEQTICIYNSQDETSEISISQCYWAKYNPVDSTIEMRGVTFKDYGDGTSARWGYVITSDEDGEFAYRMSWYSDPEGGLTTTLLGCIIGGGERNGEFALSYRGYQPADSVDYIEDQATAQVFQLNGTDFAEGTSLVTDAAFESYLDEDNYFHLEDMPTALFDSPFVTE